MTKGQSLLHGIARWTVGIGAVLSPLLFGGAEPWVESLLELTVFLGTGVWCFSLICYPAQRFNGGLLAVALLVLLGYAAIQQVAMSPSVVRRLNPVSADAVRERNEILSRIGVLDSVPAATFGDPAKASLSVSRAATRNAACLLAMYVCAFLVMANCVSRWHQVRSLSLAFVLVGFVMAVVAIVHKLSGSVDILWFHAPRYGGNVFGTFTNRNHFAFNMVMLFGFAAGLFLSSADYFETRLATTWRQRLAMFSSKRASRLALLLFALAIMGGSILLSASRGATVSLLAGVGAVVLLILLSDRNTRRIPLIAGVALLVMAVVTWIGWNPVIERFQSFAAFARDPMNDTRWLATEDTLKILGAFPLFGSGFGTFEYVFPMFARAELDFGRWLHAHNDIVQWLAEGGVIGGALIVLCMVLFVRRVIARVPASIGKVRNWMAGMVVSLVAVFLHSFGDYSLHKPANALVLSAMCGLIIAGVHLRSSAAGEHEVGGIPETTEDGDGGEATLPSGSALFRIAGLCALAGLVFMFTVKSGEFRGALAFARFEYMGKMVDRLDDRDGISKAAGEALVDASAAAYQNPCNVNNLVDTVPVVMRLAMMQRMPLKDRAGLADKAVAFSVLAVYAAPSDYLCWLWLARSQALVGQWDDAELSLERAGRLKPNGSRLVLFPGETQ